MSTYLHVDAVTSDADYLRFVSDGEVYALSREAARHLGLVADNYNPPAPTWCPTRDGLRLAIERLRRIARRAHANKLIGLFELAVEGFDALGGDGPILWDDLELDDDGGEQEAEDATNAEEKRE